MPDGSVDLRSYPKSDQGSTNWQGIGSDDGRLALIRPDKPDHGERLYSFAVISDTHVTPRDGQSNSPFPVNARANRRFRHVIADLNQREIDFVVHLGDLVHPVPETGAAYAQAAATFRAIVEPLNVPIHYVPGNHDIGDKPAAGGPVASTTPDMIAAWTREFGAQYGAFEHQGVTFILFNAQLINSGLPDEQRQRDWIEKQLKAAERRTMLMFHHPAYICQPDEPTHYDNMDPPGRGWLLNLAREHRLEALFSGHAHNFWYDRIGSTDYYLAPATSFVRQDYSEMVHATPPEGSEFGRNDRAKLGYFLVTIYEHGHSVQIVRTFGEELTDAATPHVARPCCPSPRENPSPRIGFDLRANWAESVEIPPSGALDEFDRKLARNDYPLLGLIEMGIRDIRVPLADLRCARRRTRLQALCHLGFRPTLFSYGVPSRQTVELVAGVRHVLRDWELALDWAEVESRIDEVEKAAQLTGLPIFLSPLHTHEDDNEVEGLYYHVIHHGFSVHDVEALQQIRKATGRGVVGAVFRLNNAGSLEQQLAEIEKTVTKLGIQASVHLKLGASGPAEDGREALRSLACIRQVLNIAPGLEATRVFCDSLCEVDRGYFVRDGALDVWCNPTDISSAVATAHLINETN